MNVTFSSGNSKMGNISSVSLPAVVTCRDGCPCKDKCYARKLERIRKTVRESYQRNYTLLKQKPDQYWDEINKHLKTVRFFRFHVSGDMPDADYAERVFDAAEANPKCDILCFTKQYEMVNDVLSERRLPENLHLIYSAWPGVEMKNPFHIPEAHVRFRNGFTTATAGAFECGGNCTECAETEGGCWNLKRDEQVVFDEH